MYLANATFTAAASTTTTIINDDKDSNNDDAVVAQHREYDAHSDMQNLLIIVPRVKLRNRTVDDGTSY